MFALPRQRWIQRVLHRRLQAKWAPNPNARAVVVAPHQDDEALGCGGIVLQKTSAGTSVDLVFMTDGSTSHRRFIPADQLARCRRDEALAAAAILGLRAPQVRFLDHPDGQLHQFEAAAVDQLTECFRTSNPAEIYSPYRHDGTQDHETTFRIVDAAAARAGFTGLLFEYPVWLWNQWPWVRQPLTPPRTCLQALRRAVRFQFGWRVMREFRGGAYVAPMLERKRAALAAHVTQVARSPQHPDWPILADVSDGDFLEALTSEYEIFRVTRRATTRPN